MRRGSVRFHDLCQMSVREAPTHLAGQAMLLLERIREHIARIDAGSVAALDDLAAALRIALCDGKGNEVLTRLANSAERGRVEVGLSKRPIQDRGEFSLGSVPTTEAPIAETGSRWVRLQRWPNEPLLRVETSEGARVVRWNQFVGDYANKWRGAHLGSTVPEYLWVMDEFEVAGLALSGFLLRAAGVQAWNAGQFLLADARHFWRGNDLGPSLRQQASTFVYPDGSPKGFPEDRRARGELHFFIRDNDAVEFLSCTEKWMRSEMTIRLQGISYRMTYEPPGLGRKSAVSDKTVRARQLPDQAEPLVVERIGTTFVTGRTLCFNSGYGLDGT